MLVESAAAKVAKVSALIREVECRGLRTLLCGAVSDLDAYKIRLRRY